jgi:uncharacterized protein VirK/YbjX
MPQRLPLFEPLFAGALLWAARTYFACDQQVISRKIRFVFRGLRMFEATAKWAKFIRESRLGLDVSGIALLLDQIHRPHYDRRFDPIRRADFLIEHFLAIRSKLSPDNYERLLQHQDLRLGAIVGKQDVTYEVRLTRNLQYSKEGNVCLGLYRNDEFLMTLALSLGRRADSSAACPTIFIGCIQSTKREPREQLRLATRELFGIQPRFLLIHALRALAKVWGIERIEAVAGVNHPYQQRPSDRDRVRIDYDSLWELVGGQRCQHGNYSIPLNSEFKDISAYPSEKRNEHRKRQTLLKSLADQIACTVGETLLHSARSISLSNLTLGSPGYERPKKSTTQFFGTPEISTLGGEI